MSTPSERSVELGARLEASLREGWGVLGLAQTLPLLHLDAGIEAAARTPLAGGRRERLEYHLPECPEGLGDSRERSGGFAIRRGITWGACVPEPVRTAFSALDALRDAVRVVLAQPGSARTQRLGEAARLSLARHEGNRLREAELLQRLTAAGTEREGREPLYRGARPQNDTAPSAGTAAQLDAETRALLATYDALASHLEERAAGRLRELAEMEPAPHTRAAKRGVLIVRIHRGEGTRRGKLPRGEERALTREIARGVPIWTNGEAVYLRLQSEDGIAHEAYHPISPRVRVWAQPRDLEHLHELCGIAESLWNDRDELRALMHTARDCLQTGTQAAPRP